MNKLSLFIDKRNENKMYTIIGPNGWSKDVYAARLSFTGKHAFIKDGLKEPQYIIDLDGKIEGPYAFITEGIKGYELVQENDNGPYSIRNAKGELSSAKLYDIQGWNIEGRTIFGKDENGVVKFMDLMGDEFKNSYYAAKFVPGTDIPMVQFQENGAWYYRDALGHCTPKLTHKGQDLCKILKYSFFKDEGNEGYKHLIANLSDETLIDDEYYNFITLALQEKFTNYMNCKYEGEHLSRLGNKERVDAMDMMLCLKLKRNKAREKVADMEKFQSEIDDIFNNND